MLQKTKKNKRKTLWLMLFLIGVIVLSGCKRKQEQDTIDQNQPTEVNTITITATPTTKPIITEEPTPTPIASVDPNAENLLSFDVQPVTVPEEFETPYMTKEEFPVLDGSTANIPLGEAIYCHLTGASKEDAKNDLKFYKTPDSYRRLMNKEADILFVYEPSQTILKEMMEQYAQFDFKPLGRDALVFIANETNSVDSLTKQEITDIYSGKTTNWSALGGSNQEILAFQRPATSGSQTLMEKLAVPATQLMTGPQVVMPAEMGDLIDVLASYNNASNALGYSVYFYANYMYSKPGLKFMKVDGIMPTNETIQKGEYPYVNDFYVVIRKEEPEDSKARLLYNYMTTKEAQTILTKAGYVPVVDVNATYSTANKSIEIQGNLNLMKGQFLVDHNITWLGVFEGDRILSSDYHEIITYPGKYIECGDNLILDSDIIILKSYQTVSDGESSFMHYVYELNKISTGEYLTDHPYTSAERTPDGYYHFTSYSYTSSGVEDAMYSPTGKLICKAIVTDGQSEFLDVVKGRVVCVIDKTVTIYNKDGSVVKQFEVPYDQVSQAYINIQDQYMSKDYLWLNINQSYYVIYDENGNPVNMKPFLKNVDKKPAKDELWITNGVVGTDGHLYVVGKIKDMLYLIRDDGTILYKKNLSKESYDIYLNAHVFSIYDNTQNINYYMTLEGEMLNPDGTVIPQSNETLILQKEDGFTVYPLQVPDVYFIKDKTYVRDEFYGTEGMPSPYLTSYEITTENNETKFKSSYFGIRSFDGIASIVPVGDFFILCYDTSQGLLYELMDKFGKPLYVAKNNEIIRGVYLGNEIYVAVSSGNYDEIKDLDGNFLYRKLSNDLSDD